MSKIAIVSDVHSNYDAYQKVLQKCSELNVEFYASLGDIVGYNAEPERCIEVSRNLNLIGRVRGNHDEYAGDADNAIDGFNPNAQIAVLWTASQLREDEKKWLMDAPYRANLSKYNMTLVHATLDSPNKWGYIFDEHHAMDNFNYQYTQICFCGHSHVPIAFEKQQMGFGGGKMIQELTAWREISSAANVDFSKESSVTLQLLPDRKYLFNVGSIGQPRNHDPRSSFAVYDMERSQITRYCLPYDIESAQRKILAAGLPQRLADRLSSGH